MKEILILILSTICTMSFSQGIKKENKYLSDFEYLVAKLQETHPEPYKGFGGAIAFNRAKQETAAAISENMTDKQFVLLSNRFLSNLNDGHTMIFFPKSKDELSLQFPIQFKISADGLFIHNASKKYAKYIGSFLVKVNNVSVNDLLNRVKYFEPTENMSGRYNALSRCILNPSRADKFFGTTKLKLTLKNSDGIEETIEPLFQQNVEFMAEKSTIKFKKANGLIFYKMLGKNKKVAYFRWNSMLGREIVENTYKNNPKWVKRDIDWAYTYSENNPTGNTLQDIKNIPALYEQFYHLSKDIKANKAKHLIIDLRYNGGGMTPLVNSLLYILYGNKYLNFDFEANWVRRVSSLYLQESGAKNIDDYRAYMKNKNIKEYLFYPFGNFGADMSLAQKVQKVKNGFNGFGSEYINKTPLLMDVQIIVLCSPKTFSAAYHFTYFMKKLGRTTIVGVASRQAGNTYMQSTRLTLPKTKIKGTISNSKQILFDEESESAKILRPDYEMTWEDYKKYNFDANAEILKALEIIIPR
ncbi:MAG: S41 family peptidase [Bacteroidales bacterium]|nr:S41 family peptidase [Bacteroidales bacterium]